MMDEDTLKQRPNKLTALDEAKPCVIVLTGLQMGRVFPLVDESQVIGRGQDADVFVDGAGISRHHAKIFRVGTGEVVLKDLESTNGTFVNGDLIKQSVLKDGDRIQIGSCTILKFAFQDSLDEQFQQHLYSSATRDMLTGLHNRRFFAEALDKEVSAAKRAGLPLSLVMLDIDHFKLVNDTYGHQQGDRVLRELGRLLAATVRMEDSACRLGGEEFGVIARNANLCGATKLAERLRETVCADLCRDPDRSDPLTVSIGVAQYDPARHATGEALVALADARLYAAKGAGRNRVCADGGD